jgi:predicted branched-subunit amino acid permease
MAFHREAARNGVRQILPFSLMAGPFGLVYGATAAASGIPDVPAILASFVILAGASQIALVELIDDGAAWYVAIGTALTINMRMALYSASLAPDFRAFPTPWRFGLAHLLTDQVAVVSVLQYERHTDPVYRRWFTFGAAAWFVIPWFAGTTIGVLIGGDIPEVWQIGFAVPLMFTALLVPTLVSRPKVLAAIVGAGVAVSTTWLPQGINIMLGGAAGILAGAIAAELTTEPAGPDEGPPPS